MDLMDSRVNDTMKKLNSIKHKTKLKSEKLRRIEEVYTKLLINASEQEDIKARQGKTGQQVTSNSYQNYVIKTKYYSYEM